jgi:hypothetical protein
MWRNFLKIDKFRLGELFFLAHDLRRDTLAINREGNKDRFAALARNPLAAKSDLLDF